MPPGARPCVAMRRPMDRLTRLPGTETLRPATTGASMSRSPSGPVGRGSRPRSAEKPTWRRRTSSPARSGLVRCDWDRWGQRRLREGFPRSLPARVAWPVRCTAGKSRGLEGRWGACAGMRATTGVDSFHLVVPACMGETRGSSGRTATHGGGRNGITGPAITDRGLPIVSGASLRRSIEPRAPCRSRDKTATAVGKATSSFLAPGPEERRVSLWLRREAKDPLRAETGRVRTVVIRRCAVAPCRAAVKGVHPAGAKAAGRALGPPARTRTWRPWSGRSAWTPAPVRFDAAPVAAAAGDATVVDGRPAGGDSPTRSLPGEAVVPQGAPNSGGGDAPGGRPVLGDTAGGAPGRSFPAGRMVGSKVPVG